MPLNSSIAHAQYRPDIDGLRAVAVLSVIGFHAFPEIFPGGLIGVDVFFVISGFLITGIIAVKLPDDSFSFVDFYRRRIRRIFPSLIVVLVACVAAGWFLLLPDEFALLGKHIAGGAGFVSNFILWGESGYFDKAAETKPLLHLWSLGVEEQFYIVWPLLLFATHRFRFSLSWLVGSCLVVSFLLSIIYARSDAVLAFYSPITRFWELMAGGLLAIVGSSKRDVTTTKGLTRFVRFRDIQAFIGLGAIAYPVFALGEKSTFPGWWALLPVIGAYLILSAGSGAWLNRTLLSHRVLVWVGLISYPLYLWHWPLISFLTIAESGKPAIELRIGTVLLCVVLAWMTYRFVEIPIRFGLRLNQKTYGVCAAMLLIGIVGFSTYYEGGFKGRHLGLSTASDDNNQLQRYLTKVASDPNYVEKLDDERTKAVRDRDCHMSGITFDEFRLTIDKCLTIDENRKNILILGDSHAADIYATFVSTYKEFNFLQATGAGCTPISTVLDRPNCQQLLEYTLNYIREHPVNAVVMEAIWPQDYAWISLEINRIKGLGTKVILMGPPLTFTADVPKIIDRRSAEIPFIRYIMSRVDDRELLLEGQMEKFAESVGVGFIPYIGSYCVNETCPVLNDEGELLILDQSHLTIPGETYLGEQLKRNHVLEKLLAAP